MKKSIYFWAGCALALIVITGFYGFSLTRATGGNIEYQVVCFGDSILGNYRGDTSITGYLAEETGQTVANCGLGGTTLALTNSDYRNDSKNDDLSLTRITQAVWLKDFSVLKSEFASNNDIKEYFPETLKLICRIDYKNTDVIFIEQGLNDYMSGIPLANQQDLYDCYTYGGALRTSIERLKKACPDTRIILCTPTFSEYELEAGVMKGCDVQDFGGGILSEYADTMKEIAGEYNLEVLDNYYESGITLNNVKDYTEDGIHLNEKGRKLIADRMSQLL